MEDWGRVILSPEAASARFHDKVLVLAAGAEPVTVSRSDKEERPDTENAVFDCRVSRNKQYFDQWRFSYYNILSNILYNTYLCRYYQSPKPSSGLQKATS